MYEYIYARYDRLQIDFNPLIHAKLLPMLAIITTFRKTLLDDPTAALYAAFTVFNNPITPWFSLILCLWGTIFVEQWKRQRYPTDFIIVVVGEIWDRSSLHGGGLPLLWAKIDI